MKRVGFTALFPRAFWSAFVAVGLFNSHSLIAYFVGTMFAWYSILHFQTIIRQWLKQQ